MAKQADASDLKSGISQGMCGFEPRLGQSLTSKRRPRKTPYYALFTPYPENAKDGPVKRDMELVRKIAFKMEKWPRQPRKKVSA